MKSEGWIVEGEQFGTWQNYFIDGTVSETNYFIEDQYNGYQVEYDCVGRIFSEDVYDNGDRVRIIHYDTC